MTQAFGDFREITYPDFARLFPLTDECDEHCEECDKCQEAYSRALYSPRNAALMLQTVVYLYDHLREDGSDYTELKSLLPSSPEDFEIGAVTDELFEDTDFLSLYNAKIPYAEHLEHSVGFNFQDLRVYFWFEPFRPDDE